MKVESGLLTNKAKIPLLQYCLISVIGKYQIFAKQQNKY